jgi:hypothetical protein
MNLETAVDVMLFPISSMLARAGGDVGNSPDGVKLAGRPNSVRTARDAN